MKIYKSIDELIGGTPLVELARLEKKFALRARLLAKLEAFNPAGSVKDRVAKSIIEDAERSGKLQSGATIRGWEQVLSATVKRDPVPVRAAARKTRAYFPTFWEADHQVHHPVRVRSSAAEAARDRAKRAISR